MTLLKLKKYFTKLEKKISQSRTYHIALSLSLIIGLQGLLMFFVCLKDNNFFSARISLVYSIVMLFNFTYTFITKKLKLFYILSYIVLYGLELTFLIGGGSEGFGIIWMTAIPIFTLYLFDFKRFLVLNNICYLIIILGLWTPLSQFIYPYNAVFKARFPIVYGLIFIFGIFLKHRISATENELEKQKNILTREIKQAATIQQTFFTQETKFYEKYTIAYRNIPMAGVTGDLLDIYSNNHTLEGFGIFDVSGHGVSSGLLTLLSKNIIQSEFYRDRNLELWEIVQNINDKFIQEKGRIENYLTGILLRLNDTQIELVNAGHQFPILYKKAEDTFEFIKRDPRAKGAIGIKAIDPFYYSQFITMESGDKLFLFTDGITDCENEDGDQFGTFRLLKSFERTIMTPPDEQISLILDDIRSFQKDAPAEDDMTLIILKKD